MGITEWAIINATLELAKKKPFNRITIKEITSGLGISRNTFYYHFRDIYDVLSRYLSCEVFSKLDRAESLDEFLGMVNVIFKKLNKEKTCFVKIYHTIGYEPFKEYVAKNLTASVQHLVGTMDREKSLSANDLRLICSFYQHAMAGILLDWINSDDSYTDAEIDIITRRLSVLFNGQLELIISNARLLKNGTAVQFSDKIND